MALIARKVSRAASFALSRESKVPRKCGFFSNAPMQHSKKLCYVHFSMAASSFLEYKLTTIFSNEEVSVLFQQPTVLKSCIIS